MIEQLFQGAILTFQISAASLILGMSLGTIFGIMNCKKCKKSGISHLIQCFVEIMRGTPLFVQVLILYYGLDLNLTPILAGILALGLNSAAYVSEIVRCGIDSIPEAQWEACHVLGYTHIGSIRFVILPQMIRIVLPALTNEITTVTKETSILMIIGVSELTKVGRDIVAIQLDPMPIYLAVAAIYFLITNGATMLSKMLEKRLIK